MRNRKYLFTLLFIALCFSFSFTSKAENLVSGKYEYTINKDDGTVCFEKYNGTKTSITIPAEIKGRTVTALGYNAFFNHGIIQSVKIGKNIKEIAPEAFMFAHKLKSITVDSGNKYFSSKDGILYNKSKTKILCYPHNKSGATFKIPSTVKTIESGAFYVNRNLKTLTIPSSVTRINDLSISGGKFKYLIIPGSVSTIEDHGIYHCDNLLSLRIEKGNLKTLKNSAVSYCGKLKTVYLPANVTSVGRFFECNALENIYVNSSNKNYSSKDGALFNKAKTKLIYFPAGRTDKTYIIPNTVKTISEFAFYGSHLTQIGFNKNVTKIENSNFLAYSDIEKIYYSGTKKDFNKINASESDKKYLLEHYVKVSSHVHKFTETRSKRATTTADGSIKCKCSCGYTYYKKIKEVDDILLSCSKFTYNGKKRAPVVTIYDAYGKQLTKGTDYTLTYVGTRIKPGTYTVKIKFIGNYSGATSRTFKIVSK